MDPLETLLTRRTHEHLAALERSHKMFSVPIITQLLHVLVPEKGVQACASVDVHTHASPSAVKRLAELSGWFVLLVRPHKQLPLCSDCGTLCETHVSKQTHALACTLSSFAQQWIMTARVLELATRCDARLLLDDGTPKLTRVGAAMATNTWTLLSKTFSPVDASAIEYFNTYMQRLLLSAMREIQYTLTDEQSAKLWTDRLASTGISEDLFPLVTMPPSLRFMPTSALKTISRCAVNVYVRRLLETVANGPFDAFDFSALQDAQTSNALNCELLTEDVCRRMLQLPTIQVTATDADKHPFLRARSWIFLLLAHIVHLQRREQYLITACVQAAFIATGHAAVGLCAFFNVPITPALLNSLCAPIVDAINRALFVVQQK